MLQFGKKQRHYLKQYEPRHAITTAPTQNSGISVMKADILVPAYTAHESWTQLTITGTVYYWLALGRQLTNAF